MASAADISAVTTAVVKLIDALSTAGDRRVSGGFRASAFSGYLS
jgi:hypothetical protein